MSDIIEKTTNTGKAAHSIEPLEKIVIDLAVRPPGGQNSMKEPEMLDEPRKVTKKPHGNKGGNSGSFKPNDPRAWRGGRPGTFGQWRQMAIDMGNQLAFDARGRAIVDPQGIHLTYAQVVLYKWMQEGKFTQQFADTAFGKVPLAIEVKESGPTVITVDVVDEDDDDQL